MKMLRRDFFKVSGAALAGAVLKPKEGAAGPDSAEIRTKGHQTTTTICPFCAVGCGMIVHTKGGKVINIEGDTLHPINQGALCSKGEAVFQVANNDRRLQKVMYRAPGSDHWEEKSWDWALNRIAGLMKDTRDRTFRQKEVNEKDRKEHGEPDRGNGLLGGAALNNEECYLLSPSLPGPWASSIWSTRPASDTRPRWPRWGPPSDEAP